MSEQERSGLGDEARAAQWEADRVREQAPLPYADLSSYQHEGQRQTDLAAAERSNIAHTAGELGLTSDEWSALRTKLGRPPRPTDVS